MSPNTDHVALFWSKVDKSDDCWIWTSGLNENGYGRFTTRQMTPRDWTAHRYAWTMANGCIPDGMSVCHTCDNRKCVNPAHLILAQHYTRAA